MGLKVLRVRPPRLTRQLLLGSKEVNCWETAWSRYEVPKFGSSLPDMTSVLEWDGRLDASDLHAWVLVLIS